MRLDYFLPYSASGLSPVCDWCKQPNSLLSKVAYCDGATYQACDACLPMAQIDVRCFDQAERLVQNRKQQA